MGVGVGCGVGVMVGVSVGLGVGVAVFTMGSGSCGVRMVMVMHAAQVIPNRLSRANKKSLRMILFMFRNDSPMKTNTQSAG